MKWYGWNKEPMESFWGKKNEKIVGDRFRQMLILE